MAKKRSPLITFLILVATLGTTASIVFKTYALKTRESYDLEVAKSGFLEEIAINSELSDGAKIAVCNLDYRCRHLQGNISPTSVASLIKVPIVVALMHKLTADNIDLDSEVYLDEGNVTEEDWSSLEGDRNYPLRQLLAETIINSSNTAPNQLIDYLTRGYINRVLAERGYQVTRVNSKFIGKTTVPFDLGRRRNSLNADELTAMMVQIYNREHPGDEILIKILGLQYDRDLGYAALQGTNARWLGEKTGQNTSVLGTTLAMKVAGEIYIVTVIDDGEYSEAAIRNSVAQIADYLDRNSGL